MTLPAIMMTLTIGLALNSGPSPSASLAGLGGSKHSAKLQALVDDAVKATRGEFSAAQLDSSQIAATLVDLSRGAVEWGSSRGQIPIYPASVVKLFYLVATCDALEHQRLADTDELRRAMHDMIVDSSNDATAYVLDLLTGTTSGPELDSLTLQAWVEQRNTVNRLFASRGYAGINCNKKPWGDGPYGRETQASKAFTPSRNMLTTDATARLLTEIVTGHAAGAERTQQMLELLARDPQSPSADPDNEANGFSGSAVAAGMKLWSKAGWTSRARHDAACIELADGRRFVVVVFTEGHANERGVIPALVRRIIAGVGSR